MLKGILDEGVNRRRSLTSVRFRKTENVKVSKRITNIASFVVDVREYCLCVTKIRGVLLCENRKFLEIHQPIADGVPITQ